MPGCSGGGPPNAIVREQDGWLGLGQMPEGGLIHTFAKPFVPSLRVEVGVGDAINGCVFWQTFQKCCHIVRTGVLLPLIAHNVKNPKMPDQGIIPGVGDSGFEGPI